MRRLLLFTLPLLLMASPSLGSEGNPFAMDMELIHAEMAGLHELEGHVLATGATHSDLALANSSLIANVAASSSLAGVTATARPPLGIPPFWWGLCLGVVGLAVVYFATEDSAQTRRALWGCIAHTALASVATGVAFLYFLLMAMAAPVY